ncbi:MAG: PHP domain-containing protein [Pleurocapsa minor GSE-CHR-MK-17-07R]|jgi:predicted metal-dependent phosphoesterase TrpH|nr:PHP domain-containing protein [Pleurocapsa minor GSE-CHR-MK 17-07R]
MRIDLHVHTHASDGQHAPSEVVRMARARDIRVLAITDHDTTDGIAEAIAAAAVTAPLTKPLRIIPGIEISAAETTFDAEKGRERTLDVHMLGYFIDRDSAALQEKLAAMREARVSRGRRIVEKLAALGVTISWERVAQFAEGASVGRPHIARAMVEAGHVETVREAFDRFLHNGAPAYVPRLRVTPEDAIALIHEAGGVAVMAHPALVEGYLALLERLAGAGLDGVEVFHPSNDENARLNLKAAAARYHLLMTGGSDFHGEAIKPGVFIGMQAPPFAVVSALETRAAHYR